VIDHPHKGTDIAVPTGTDVRAPQGGEVEKAGWENPNAHKQGYGLRVTIDVVKPHEQQLINA
jgi:murein DD-endopeptidase MepM/ murein hydrolase activator NlpD